MWSELLPKMVGGTLIDHDEPNSPTEIVGYELTETHAYIKGRDFDFGGSRRYMGISANGQPGSFRVSGYGIEATVRMPGK